ncbi:hypothetical protein Tco_1356083 [Tanacetum coccineum]
MMRAAAPSTYTLAPPSGIPLLLPIPLPTPSPPLLLPSIDRRVDRPERLGVIQIEMLVMGLQTLEMRCLQDTDEIYGRLDEAQDARAMLSGRLNLLRRDRRSHAYTTLLMEREARLSCEAWGRSMAASDATCYEVMELRTTLLDTDDSTAGTEGTR